MYRKAVRHLTKADPVLSDVIVRVGSCRLEIASELSLFESLARSIVYQQLSGKAAATIYGRVSSLCAHERVTAAELTRLSPIQLRSAGLSGQKLGYLKDLSSRTLAGEIPFDSLADLSDDDVIGHLTRVKGVGRWTAQMFLMFRLGRPDVLPELDLGVQKGIRKAYRLRKHPTPERVVKIGARWAPYRSVASWYMWRILELE